jgi:glycosyltransferase involved in cell wall biosynthesis
MKNNNHPLITVITVSLNAEGTIDDLIYSLENQTNKNFCWIVKDGGSSDQTLTKVRNAKISNLIIIEGPDFGPYDGMNQALKICNTDYYLVIGADDWFYSNAVRTYEDEIIKNNYPDLITASIMCEGKVCKKSPSWTFPFRFQMAVVSAHSVGSCIKKSLHNKIGFYNQRYWLVADALFLMQCRKINSKVTVIDDLVGVFGNKGQTNNFTLSALCGNLRIQVEDLKWNIWFSLIIFLIKIIKNKNKIK